ncbi:hypothetical protein Tco_0335962 [Tanacetum coccineum]
MQAITLKTCLGEGCEDKGHLRPNRESVSAFNLSKSSVHPESAPRNDASGFLMSTTNLETLDFARTYNILCMKELESILPKHQTNEEPIIKSLRHISFDKDMEDAL